MRFSIQAAALGLLLLSPALTSVAGAEPGPPAPGATGPEALESQLLPDLQVEEFSVPRDLRAGQEALLEVRVANRGQAETGGARVRLRVDGRVVGTWRLQQHLFPGDRERVPLRWTPEKAGNGTFSVEVDPDGGVAESDEGNNVREAPFVVAERPQVDLEAKALVAREPLREGSPGEVLVTVSNRGEAPAHSVRVRLVLEGRTVAERTVRAELPPRATRALPVSWIPDRAGDLELTAELEVGAGSDEASREDNRVRALLPVAPRLAADLAAVRLECPSLLLGKEAQMQAVVRNAGDLPVFGCRVFLLADGVPVASANAPSGLEPGDEIRVPLTWTPDRAGTRTLQIEVQAHQGTTERSLEDNRASLEVTVVPPVQR